MRRRRQIIINGLLLGLIASEAEEDDVVIDFDLRPHEYKP